MEDDPSFNFTAMLSRGGKAYVQFGEPERQVNLGGFPQSRAELDWFDVIVLGDVHPSRWPRGLSSAIADAVIEGGKSLVLVAGPAMNQVAQVRELNALLPVELSSESAQPREGPIALQITPAGAQSPFFAGASGSIGQLPAVDSIYPPLRKRPGATVLVEAAEAANESGPLVVLAEQTVGRGRVMYIGADTLWKWQSLSPLDENGKTVYSRFWEQTLRALTPPRTAKSATLSLQADRSRYEAGSRTMLRAKLPAEHVSDELTLQASVVLPDEQRIPLAFTPDQTESGVFVSQFETMLPGSYRVSLAATTNGQLVGETSLAVEVTSDRTELDDSGIDLARLTRIASRTGGKVVDLGDPQTWPAPASATPPMIQETHTTNLLENLSLVVLLCGVLGSDWLLRLLRGLV
jgi:hypothetical protein